jgi:hypothetical protein
MAATATPGPYKGADIQAAYQAIYGGLPASMMDLKSGNLLPQYQEQGFQPGQVLTTPTGQEIQASQLMSMYQSAQAAQQAKAAQQAQAATAGGGTAQAYASPAFTGNYASALGTQSYLGTGTSAGASMANGSPVISTGQVLYNQSGAPLTAAQTAQMMSLYGQYQAGDMRAGNQAVQLARSLGLGNLDQAVSNLQNQTGPNASTNTTQPETAALQQMQQIDPASEALRTQLSQSYLTPLQQAQNPTAQQYQNYLDIYKQVDPEQYAQQQGLATSMDSYLKSVQDQYALGSQLDPVTARQVEQQTRAGQAARGNVYGTPQMAEEAMTTGQAGLALQQQRLGNLQTALGAQQGYLGSGLGLGSTAMNLYQQGLQNTANAQAGALSYLNSGQTPYQAGSAYVNQANQNAAMAAQGGPQYNPSALGSSYGAAQIPQYGLDIGQQAQNWYNSFSAYGGAGTPTKNKGAAAASGAATGALSGAIGGATIGSAVPVVGTLAGAAIGAVGGGVLGGAGGYFS